MTKSYMGTGFVLCLLGVLFHELCSLKETFFISRPGLVWDNCMVAGPVSQLYCSVQCSCMDSCLGFNFNYDYDVNSSSLTECQICLSTEIKTISSSFSSSSKAMQTLTLHFRYSTMVYAPTGVTEYIVQIPNGLFHGKVIMFRLKIEDNLEQTFINFMDRASLIMDNEYAERDLMVHVTFNYQIRPYAIALHAYNRAEQKWQGHWQSKNVFDYLSFGMDYDVIILAHDLSYTIYINGKLLSVYPRTGRISLEDVVALRIHSAFYSVFL